MVQIYDYIYRMYQVNHIISMTDAGQYIREYRDVARFIGYCHQCNRYRTCWACPPFAFDTDEYLSGYRYLYIIGSKIIPDQALVQECTQPDHCKDISYRIIAGVRKTLDEQLLTMESGYPGSRAFFAGTCHFCPEDSCTRSLGKPCIYPDKIRPSLESLGFDIGKTSSLLLHTDLKWSNGLLPEYFMLVSGFMTNHQPGDLTGFFE